MLRVITVSMMCGIVVSACDRLSPLEKKIVGAWSWTYIEGQGRMEFTANHKLKVGFPRDEVRFWQSRFIWLDSGMWHLEGDVLVTETNNQLFLDMAPRSTMEKYPFETRKECQKIVYMDNEKMIFDDGYSLDRDHR